jgi:uncharacterized membrane protein YvbJ
MKYCRECGQKAEPVGGNTPKFCANCGTPFDMVKAATQKETTNHEDTTVSFSADIDMFEIEGSKNDDAATFKFEDIVGSQKEKRVLNRQKGIASLDDFKARMSSDKRIDA